MSPDSFQTTLPEIKISKENVFRIVYTGEAAFLRNNSRENFLIAPITSPTIAIVLSVGDQHLLLHKQSSTNLRSLDELLFLFGVKSEKFSDIKATIFSYKYNEELYKKNKYHVAHNGRTQEQEIEYSKDILVAVLGLDDSKITTVLTQGIWEVNDTLVVDKNGRVFQTTSLNSALWDIEELDIFWHSLSYLEGYNPQEYAKVRQKVRYNFTNRSQLRFTVAYPCRNENEPRYYGADKPFILRGNVPSEAWPQYDICKYSSCQNLGVITGGANKIARYCSHECYVRDFEPSSSKRKHE